MHMPAKWGEQRISIPFGAIDWWWFAPSHLVRDMEVGKAWWGTLWWETVALQWGITTIGDAAWDHLDDGYHPLLLIPPYMNGMNGKVVK